MGYAMPPIFCNNKNKLIKMLDKINKKINKLTEFKNEIEKKVNEIKK